MESLRKLIYTILIMITTFCIGSLIAGYTLVIPISKNTQPRNLTIVKGDTISVFERADFSRGDWSVYVNLDRSDFKSLSPSIEKAYCIKTSDIRLLERMKQKWKFVYKAADMATVESSVYVFHDGKLVFQAGIVLDRDKQGLQNSTYGWMEPTDRGALAETCKNFKRVYWPIIIL